LARRTARGVDTEDEDNEEEHERALWIAQIHLIIHQTQDQFVHIKRYTLSLDTYSSFSFEYTYNSEMEMFEVEVVREKMSPAELRASQPVRDSPTSPSNLTCWLTRFVCRLSSK
jgi:hypothetical protein